MHYITPCRGHTAPHSHHSGRALRLAFGRVRLFQNAGASRARRVALITKLVRRAAARGRARVEHGAAAAGLHSLRCALRLSPASASLSAGASELGYAVLGACAARELKAMLSAGPIELSGRM